MTDALALNRQVCFALYSASRETTAAYRSMLDRLGVTYPQYLVLLVLWEQDGRGVHDICEALNLDTGTVSPLLKRLESMGLIKRERLTTDERRVQIHLTDAGSALKAQAADIPAQLGRASGLTVEELTHLRDVLSRLSAALHSSTNQQSSTNQEEQR
ncbi:MAG: MarR family winged helix-turn-helix transcriptional regulator [Mycobacteriaceae bacterium]